MKVTLINHTPDADVLLLFTKATRLNMTPSLLDEIRAMTLADRLKELEYMAATIPSSWEFVDYVFLVEGVSRAYTHQQVRTRAGSYAQQSLRVVDAGEFEYVFTERNKANKAAKRAIEELNEKTKMTYQVLRAIGQPPEDARGILPTNIATNIVCKFNLRTLAELAKSRTGGRTQNEYQQVINAMIDAVIAVHPWANLFLFPKGRDLFAEIEAFAAREYPDNLLKKGELLKIVDQLRKELK
jgi:flavin-dependent thymidylate synthase